MMRLYISLHIHPVMSIYCSIGTSFVVVVVTPVEA